MNNKSSLSTVLSNAKQLMSLPTREVLSMSFRDVLNLIFSNNETSVPDDEFEELNAFIDSLPPTPSESDRFEAITEEMYVIRKKVLHFLHTQADVVIDSSILKYILGKELSEIDKDEVGGIFAVIVEVGREYFDTVVYESVTRTLKRNERSVIRKEIMGKLGK